MISEHAYIEHPRSIGSHGHHSNGVIITTPQRVQELVDAMNHRQVIIPAPKIIVNDPFSPKTLDEFIGQLPAKAMIKIMINAAKKEHRNLPNILIVSGFGLGKTTLAKLILQNVTNGTGALARDAASLTAENLPKGGMVLIDEIHNLKPEIADSLNLLIDSGNLSIIGCTTSPALVPAAFKSRFRSIYLEPYTVDDLTQILTSICARKHVSADRARLVEVAARSRRNARAATNNIGFIFDYMAASSVPLSKATIELAFSMLGIDEKGYLKRDHKYVDSLIDRPVGLQYLVQKSGIDAKTIEEEVEPFLLQNGIIDRTPKGRIKLQDI